MAQAVTIPGCRCETLPDWRKEKAQPVEILTSVRRANPVWG